MTKGLDFECDMTITYKNLDGSDEKEQVYKIALHYIHFCVNEGKHHILSHYFKEIDAYLNNDAVLAVSKLLGSKMKECDGHTENREGICWYPLMNGHVFRC
jgi:hypothetical protein